MRRYMVAEIRRSLTNVWFCLALSLSCAIAVASAVGAVVSSLRDFEKVLLHWEEAFSSYSPFSCLRQWIELDFTQPTTDIFYIVLPLLVALPFSWSLYEDRKTGYAMQELTRVGRSSYYYSKYIVIGLSGSMVGIIPILLNLLICALFLPYLEPEVSDAIYWGVSADWLWSDILYSNSVVYALLSVLKIGIFGALWSCVCASVSLVLHNRIASMLIPYIVLLLIEFLQGMVLGVVVPYALSPIEYLRGGATAFNSNGWVVVAEFALLMVVNAVAVKAQKRHDYL